MSVSSIITLGYGGFSNVNLIPTLGYLESFAFEVVVGGAGKGHERKHLRHAKRWILPNGQHIFGTYENVQALLETAVFDKPKPAQTKKKVSVRARLNPVVELVSFKTLRFRDEDVVKVNLKNVAIWKPDKKAYAKALQNIEDEDTVVALLLLH